MILAWIFIPLEHPRWQRIRAEHKNLYPHINASRPRPLDPVRYLIQTCWLLISCIAQRNAETAQAGIFRSTKYSWTLPSMDERVA